MLALLTSFELGMWLSGLLFGAMSRTRVKNALNASTHRRIALPILDAELSRRTLSANLFQRKAAALTTAGLRKLANTRALELAVLLGIQLKQAHPNQKVRIHV